MSCQGTSYVEASTCIVSTLEHCTKCKMCQYANLSLILFFINRQNLWMYYICKKNDARNACILASFTQWRPLNLCNPSLVLPSMY